MQDLKKLDEVVVTLIKDLTALHKVLTAEEEKVEPKKATITLEEIRTVLAELSRDGFTKEIREIFTKHGAKKLSELDPSEYESVIEEAKALKDAS